MGFLGGVFKFVGEAASGAMDDMIMSRANELRGSQLLRNVVEKATASYGRGWSDFDLSNYLRHGEYIALFYAHMLSGSSLQAVDVFKFIFNDDLEAGMRKIKRNCSSSNRRLSELSIAAIDILKGDGELGRILKDC